MFAKSRGSRAGFTVAEMLVATVILGVGMLALAGLMATVMGRHTRATVEQEMTTLAESKLEELRAASIIKAADPLVLTELHRGVDIGGSVTSAVENHADTVSAVQAVGAAGRTYYRRWEVSAGPAGTRAVTLRVEMTQTHSRHKIQPKDFSTLLMVVR